MRSMKQHRNQKKNDYQDMLQGINWPLLINEIVPLRDKDFDEWFKRRAQIAGDLIMFLEADCLYALDPAILQSCDTKLATKIAAERSKADRDIVEQQWQRNTMNHISWVSEDGRLYQVIVGMIFWLP